MDCTFPICTPCWDAEGGTGRHRNVPITEPPLILPPLPPNKTKKPKKEKPAMKTARPRKNVVISDSEPEDYAISDAAAKIGKPKKRSMTLKTDYTVASSNDENSEEVHEAITNDVPQALTSLQYSEDVLKAADLLLGFFHAADTPESASSATSTNSGLAAVLDATGTIDRRPNPSPRQQKPPASFKSDPAAHLYESDKQYPRHEHPCVMPEEGHHDVDMYGYGPASSFTPINPRKEIVKSRENSLLSANESSKNLAKAPQQPPESPTDRFIHHSRTKSPREAAGYDRGSHGMQLPEYRCEEADSDVEILGARELRHAEPSFGRGNGNAGGCESDIIDRHGDQS